MDKKHKFVKKYGDRAALFLDLVFRAEGGFGDHPMDAGGQTMRGVTFDVFRECASMLGLKFFSSDAAKDYHANLTEDEAAVIYIERFWKRSGMHQLPAPELGPWAPLAITVADHQVNAGSWGVIGLQRLVGVKEDGNVGPITMKAITSHDPFVLYVDYQTWRRQYYRSVRIKNFNDAEMAIWHATFGKGLQNRVTNLDNALRTRGLIS